ncbi:MAG: 30S ribosomal protein S7 [Acidobacteriota bacterium]
MPRKKIDKKKEIVVDPVYNSSIIAKFINNVMQDGKKAKAQKIVYGAMDVIKDKTKEDPLKVVLKAIDNIRPLIETRSRRVGGATYQVPMDVRKERSFALGLRWLVQYASERGGKSFQDKIVGEILDGYSNKGGAVKKRETVQKMADSNRAFAHYRW